MNGDDMAVYTVTVQPAGWVFAAPASLPLLVAAQRAGIRLPSSCRNGTCRTCLCESRHGEVAYRIEWPGLSADEKAAGSILPCVAHARSDLVIEQPAARRVPRHEEAAG
ncbi:2Fe-2S iron-sulfur cluster-binding protein [Methylibium sp. Root1272]|uniref:2Fe-2S iron-sulfur cluster-binding protein n=1 Tax=Methylibium sp. Root1272 TaxID=1736441 RepID=UPI0009E91AFE|nr:2Fe-2S iron-sulfur cluster-binding protein [Methylibium sp. Root1272]